MSKPHSNNPPQRSIAASPSPVSDLIGTAASRSSRDRHLIRQALSGLGKQPVPSTAEAGAVSALSTSGHRGSSVQTVLELLGHSPECARLARAGLLTSCHCRVKAADDPAVVVGLAVQFARSALTHGVPLPASVTERLTKAVEAGDPACQSVAAWLADLGLLELREQSSAEEGGR